MRIDLKQLEALLGTDQVGVPEQNNRYSLAGLPPLPVAYVRTIEQLSEVMRLSSSENWAIIPVGGGTKLDIGNSPRRADLFLSTSQMNSVVEHPAADLTATVFAGCTLSAFQETIGRHGQFLPLDAPYADRATIGGILAAASHGPSRLAWNTARDWLIGIKVVTPDGKVTKAGGKVVKNVAGYDLMKLYTGSFGTLAVITELSFKLRPQPAAETTLIGIFSTLEELMEAARRLLESQLAPVALELLSGRALRICFPEAAANNDEQLALAVRLAGLTEALEYQKAQLPDLWRGSDLVEIKDSSRAGWKCVADFGEHYSHQAAIRISVLPSRLRSILPLVVENLSSLGSDFEILAHAGNGIARVYVNEIAENMLPKWQVAITALRKSGSVVIERAPLAIKQQIDVWGEVRSAAELMRTIKQKIDPKGILNPGRFVAGI